DGKFPVGGVVRDAAGNLFGTTQFGGSTAAPCDPRLGCGIVFEIDASGSETILFTFEGKRDGADPVAGLALDSQGNIFGTGTGGGTTKCNNGFGCGMVFQMNQSGKEKVLHTFLGSPTDGFSPQGPLLRNGGSFYGTTHNGGAFSDCGTIFKYTPHGV